MGSHRQSQRRRNVSKKELSGTISVWPWRGRMSRTDIVWRSGTLPMDALHMTPVIVTALKIWAWCPPLMSVLPRHFPASSCAQSSLLFSSSIGGSLSAFSMSMGSYLPKLGKFSVRFLRVLSEWMYLCLFPEWRLLLRLAIACWRSLLISWTTVQFPLAAPVFSSSWLSICLLWTTHPPRVSSVLTYSCECALFHFCVCVFTRGDFGAWLQVFAAGASCSIRARHVCLRHWSECWALQGASELW